MTVYLTTAGAVVAVRRGKASERSRASVGPGPVYSIMRHPRADYGECGAGRVLGLTPLAAELEAVRAAGLADDAWATYEAALLARWTTPAHAARLAPGRLAWASPAHSRWDPDGKPWDGDLWVRREVVEDGATLVCGCGVAQADAGRCHRVVAARLLASLGWRVVLDGRELTVVETPGPREDGCTLDEGR